MWELCCFFLINVMKLVFNDDVAQQCELLTTVFEMSATFQENYIFFREYAVWERCYYIILYYTLFHYSFA